MRGGGRRQTARSHRAFAPVASDYPIYRVSQMRDALTAFKPTTRTLIWRRAQAGLTSAPALNAPYTESEALTLGGLCAPGGDSGFTGPTYATC